MGPSRPRTGHGPRGDLAAHRRAALPEHEARAVAAQRESDAVGLRAASLVQRDRFGEAALAARREPERGIARAPLGVPRREHAAVGRERQRATAMRARLEHPAVVADALGSSRRRTACAATTRTPCRVRDLGIRRARARRRGRTRRPPPQCDNTDTCARRARRARPRLRPRRAQRVSPRQAPPPTRSTPRSRPRVRRQRATRTRASPARLRSGAAARRRFGRRPRSSRARGPTRTENHPGSRRGDDQLTWMRPSAPAASPGGWCPLATGRARESTRTSAASPAFSVAVCTLAPASSRRIQARCGLPSGASASAGSVTCAACGAPACANSRREATLATSALSLRVAARERTGQQRQRAAHALHCQRHSMPPNTPRPSPGSK